MPEKFHHALASLLTSLKFRSLEAEIRRLSALEILGVAEREVSHASFLRWMLDPQAGHGLGDTPLRTFIQRLAMKYDRPEHALEFKRGELREATVKSEYTIPDTGRLDIVAFHNEKPILAIEHKVRALQGIDQTQKYGKWLDSKEDNEKANKPGCLRAFTCPANTTQEEELGGGFKLFEYPDLCDWLRELAGEPRLSSHAYFLIREYIRCIESRDLGGLRLYAPLLEEIKGDAELAGYLHTLRDAIGGGNVGELEQHIVEHEDALQLLGIGLKRPASKGDSGFVARMRRLAEAEFSEKIWSLYGKTGSLTISLPAYGTAIRESIGDSGGHEQGKPYLQFWVSRIEDESAEISLYSGRYDIIDKKATQLKAVIAELAKSLKDRIRERVKSIEGAKMRGGNAICSIALKFSGIKTPEDDEKEKLKSHEGELMKAEQFLKIVGKTVEEWSGETLEQEAGKLAKQHERGA